MVVDAGSLRDEQPALSVSDRTDVEAQRMLARGENPYPVHLERPVAAPLSAMARLGARMFFDASLSASGRLSCASCHSPANHYGPPTAAPVMPGPESVPGAVPSAPVL